MWGESFQVNFLKVYKKGSSSLTLKFCSIYIIPILLGEKSSLIQLCVLVFNEVLKILKLF